MKKLFLLWSVIFLSFNATFANDEIKYTETPDTLNNSWIMLITDTKLENTWVQNTTKLSDNDFWFYNHLLKQVSLKDQKVINNFLDKYNKKLSTYSKENQEKINKKAVWIVSDYIFENITLKYPQDIALPKKANRIFLTLSLLELELKK